MSTPHSPSCSSIIHLTHPGPPPLLAGTGVNRLISLKLDFVREQLQEQSSNCGDRRQLPSILPCTCTSWLSLLSLCPSPPMERKRTSTRTHMATIASILIAQEPDSPTLTAPPLPPSTWPARTSPETSPPSRPATSWWACSGRTTTAMMAAMVLTFPA